MYEHLTCDFLCRHIHSVVEVPLRGRRDKELREQPCDQESHEVHYQLVLVHKLLLGRVSQVTHSEKENGRHFKNAGQEYGPDHHFLSDWNRGIHFSLII